MGQVLYLANLRWGKPNKGFILRHRVTYNPYFSMSLGPSVHPSTLLSLSLSLSILLSLCPNPGYYTKLLELYQSFKFDLLNNTYTVILVLMMLNAKMLGHNAKMLPHLCMFN